MTYQQRIDAARAVYGSALKEVAVDIGRELIEPFCRKWSVPFVAGMGVWSFYAPAAARRDPGRPIDPEDYRPDSGDSPDDQAYFAYDLPAEFWREFADLTKTLEGVDRDMFVASYVPSVTLRDGREVGS